MQRPKAGAWGEGATLHPEEDAVRRGEPIIWEGVEAERKPPYR
jgi:hypothetical protein